MNSTIQHKGYCAKIEYSSEDKLLIGRVVGVLDTLIFDAESVTELETRFHEVIDDYLQMCADCGKKPEKAFKGVFNVRVSPEIHRALVIKAEKQNVTLNQLVAGALDAVCTGTSETQFVFSPHFHLTAPVERVRDFSKKQSSVSDAVNLWTHNAGSIRKSSMN